MNPTLPKTLLISLVTVGSLTAWGGPLRRADVAGEPAWLVHVDCDAFRSTALWQHVQDELEKPEAKAKLAAFQALANFDLRTQLHGLTLYSVGSAPEDGVLVVYADFDAERLVTLAKAAKDSQSTTYKEHVIYNWIDDKKKPKDGLQPRTYAAIVGKRVVFGQRERPVAQALDVISGGSANLSAGNAFPALGATGGSSFIQAAARKMDFLKGDPNAQVLRLSKQVTLEVGETQRQVGAVLALQANDEEVASNINSILNGLISLLKLQTEKPEAVKFAQALVLRQDGAVVNLKLTLPVNDVIRFVKDDAARKAQKKAAKEN